MTDTQTAEPTSSIPHIVHETERQRQYTRLQVPLSIKIGGQQLDLIDWSVGGFSMASRDLHLAVGGSYSGKIVIPFPDFEMEVKVRFQVRYRDEATCRMGCRLIDQTPAQLSILQYLVHAHVAGEVVHMNDVFTVIQRNDALLSRDAPKPSPREAARHRVRRWLFGGAMTLLFAVMLTLLATSLYERLFVIEASSAVVTSDLIRIAAPQGGRVALAADVRDGSVAIGDLLATITTPGGSTYFVESSCDCRIVDLLTSDDSQVGVGTNLMLLAPTDAAVRVSALVPYEDALRLQEGMRATLAYPAAGTTTQGTIDRIDMRRQLTELGQPVMEPGAIISSELVIVPDGELPIQWIGRPVAVTVDTLAPTWAGLIGGDAAE